MSPSSFTRDSSIVDPPSQSSLSEQLNDGGRVSEGEFASGDVEAREEGTEAADREESYCKSRQIHSYLTYYEDNYVLNFVLKSNFRDFDV